MDLSISDYRLYVRCRRAWDYASPNRRGLRKIGVPTAALHIGSAVHAALQAQAEAEIGEYVADFAVQSYFLTAQAEYVANYEDALGFKPSQAEVDAVGEAEGLVRELVRRYFDRYGIAESLGPGMRYVAVEQTFRVPIPGTDGFLVGTLDGLVKDDKGRFFVVDHKTFSVSPDLDKLRNDEQFTAYAWAAGAILGEPVAGVLYDGISKKLSKPPKTLAKGGLSVAYSDAIDYVTYRQAIEDHGLDPHDYDDILSKLRERDARQVTPFYARYALSISRAQMDAFAGYLPAVYREMTSDPAIYPSYNYIMGCFDCNVKDLCHATQHGEDVDWLIRTIYHKSAGSQSFKQRHGQEVEVDATSFA